jgi:hypothetical protein
MVILLIVTNIEFLIKKLMLQLEQENVELQGMDTFPPDTSTFVQVRLMEDAGNEDPSRIGINLILTHDDPSNFVAAQQPTTP